MREKLQVVGIAIMAWCCFFEAITAPRWIGIPAVLNLFGVYELQITISLWALIELGYLPPFALFLIFLYMVVPIFMGVLFIYYTCVHLFAPKLKIVTVTQEELERTNIMLDNLKHQRSAKTEGTKS